MGPADVHPTFGEIAPRLERVAPELEGANFNQVRAVRSPAGVEKYSAMAEHDSRSLFMRMTMSVNVMGQSVLFHSLLVPWLKLY